MKRLAALIGASLSVAAQAQPQLQPLPPAVLPVAAGAGAKIAAAIDDTARMSVPVTIGGRLWNFLIDTASTRSVIASDVADSLDLAKGDALQILNIAGTDIVPSVIIPDLRFSDFVVRDIHAPSLLRSNLGGDGLLGLDMLRGSRVSIDFRQATNLTISPSSRKQEPATRDDSGAIVVVARSRMGELIVTHAEIDGIPAVVILDTGSEGSIGNPVLAKLLARRSARAPLLAATVIGVTGRTLPANYQVIDQLQVGDVVIKRVPVAFADVATFQRFGLANRPAILLGMETLRLFARVAIDFPRHEIRFWLRASSPERDAIQTAW